MAEGIPIPFSYETVEIIFDSLSDLLDYYDESEITNRPSEMDMEAAERILDDLE